MKTLRRRWILGIEAHGLAGFEHEGERAGAIGVAHQNRFGNLDLIEKSVGDIPVPRGTSKAADEACLQAGPVERNAGRNHAPHEGLEQGDEVRHAHRLFEQPCLDLQGSSVPPARIRVHAPIGASARSHRDNLVGPDSYICVASDEYSVEPAVAQVSATHIVRASVVTSRRQSGIDRPREFVPAQRPVADP